MNLSNLCISRSCAIPSGLGLFVREQGYKKGDRLPYDYQGVRIDDDKYDLLNDYLCDLTNMENMTKEEEDAHIENLVSMYDLHVSRSNKDERVDWDAVYDNFVVYNMETNELTKEKMFWPRYNAQGKPQPDERFQMYGLYINEPPPYDYFYNTFDKRNGFGRMQKSKCNVEIAVNSDTNQIEFYALQKIEPFDELLFFYGPFYNRRGYKINLRGIPQELIERLRDCKKDWEPHCFEMFKEMERDRKRYKSDGIMFVRK